MIQELINMIMNYEEVQNKLRLRLSTKELDDEPHVRAFADVFAYFEVDLSGTSELDDVVAHVTYDLQGKWGKTSEELFEDALANTDVEYTDFMGAFIVVSVPGMFHGASAILKAKLEEGDIIIPSSIHECLIVKGFDIKEDKERFEDMINMVNANEVAEHEVLSDHAYVFDGEKIVSA